MPVQSFSFIMYHHKTRLVPATGGWHTESADIGFSVHGEHAWTESTSTLISLVPPDPPGWLTIIGCLWRG